MKSVSTTTYFNILKTNWYAISYVKIVKKIFYIKTLSNTYKETVVKVKCSNATLRGDYYFV
jgi:hypothetical protein